MIFADWPRRHRWWLLALGLTALFVPGWWRAWQLQLRADRLDTEIAALDAENRRLLVEMEHLQNDPLYLERVARRKLGLTRKGEVVYKVSP